MIWWAVGCRPDGEVVLPDPPSAGAPAGSPVAVHGALHLDGLQLTDASGAPIQLRGVSDQGIQWFPWGTCFDDASLAFLTDPQGMNVDVVRVPVYVREGGWLRDPDRATVDAARLVDEAIARGLYVVLDWHVTSYDPNDTLEEALAFWGVFAARYAGSPNLLFELANEPSHCTWADVVAYAEQVIPAVRAVDLEVPLLLGTPDDSADLAAAAAAPLSGDLAHNLLYTYHFYAGSMDADDVSPFVGQLPLFVSEWGAASWSGDSPDDYPGADAFLAHLTDGDVAVSWVGWSFTDDRESSAMLVPGTCGTDGAPGGPYTVDGLSTAGRFVRDHLGL